jgi:hypothetical protein
MGGLNMIPQPLSLPLHSPLHTRTRTLSPSLTPSHPLQAYDDWRAAAQVLRAPEPAAVLPMQLYDSLLGGVAPERVSVPVVMHAMLEQVARNMQVRGGRGS